MLFTHHHTSSLDSVDSNPSGDTSAVVAVAAVAVEVVVQRVFVGGEQKLQLEILQSDLDLGTVADFCHINNC